MASAFSRRTALATAAVASAVPLTAKAATKRSKIDFTKPEDSLYAVVKLRGDLSGKRVLQWYTGTLSLVVPGKLPTPVCRYQGIIRTNWVPQPDGSYSYRTFDLGFFGNLETGEHV